MTNEQAIEVINGHIKDSSVAYGTSTGQALRMAVEALKAQLSEEGTTKDTTSELISRQAAIDAIHNLYAIHGSEGSWIDQKDAFNAVNNLPPAQPERKKGKWIKNDNGTYSCSLCHSWIPEEQYYYAQFCLYCGADMRGEQNEL